MTNTTGFLLAAGHISKSALQDDDAYIVENFTRNPDETWVVGLAKENKLMPHKLRQTLLNGRDTGLGYASFEWMMLLSSSQLTHLKTNYSNGLDGLVTAQTFNVVDGVWECYTAILKIKYEQVLTSNDRWLPGYVLKFQKATLLSD